MNEDKITPIFVDVDDFCRSVLKNWYKLQKRIHNRKRIRHRQLSESEIITIMLLFHLSHYRNFKQFYLLSIKNNLSEFFPSAMSYPRMVIAMQSLSDLLALYLKNRLSQPTGIAFIDSTSLKVCHNKRILRHRVFKHIAKRGKSSMGWFYGFKLHLVINHQGELLSAMVTSGEVDDRKPVIDLTAHLSGNLYGDKGYLSEILTNTLREKGITLITNVRKNMKNKFISCFDKAVLRKRFIIETVNDVLKNVCQIEHTRHRSIANFMNNLLSGLIAYTFLENKPKCLIHEI